MKQPRISAIIPVYNCEQFISESIESILAQTYPVAEIIVVDDGSNDTTEAVVATFGDKVRYIYQKTAGPAATRNHGAREATGDFVSFLDADDRWHPEKLERQMARFDAIPNLEISITHAQKFWDASMREEEERLRDHARAQSIPAFVSSAMLAPATIFQKTGTFPEDTDLTDQLEWFLHAQELGVVIDILPDVLLFHRMHPTNITRRREAEFREKILEFIAAKLKRERNKASETS